MGVSIQHKFHIIQEWWESKNFRRMCDFSHFGFLARDDVLFSLFGLQFIDTRVNKLVHLMMPINICPILEKRKTPQI